MTAQADTRRMAETAQTGSGRSPSGTVGEADAPMTLLTTPKAQRRAA